MGKMKLFLKKDIGRITVAIIVAWILSGLIIIGFVEPDHRGTAGDMFGAINSLFSGFAFAGIIYTILLQKKEFALQREQLELQRHEVARSTAELAEQNKNMTKQRFETTFFNLISAHDNLVSSVTVTHKKANGNSLIEETLTGRAAIDEYFGYIKSNSSKNPERIDVVGHYTSQLVNFEVCYTNFIFILRYILDIKFGKETKNEYLNIFFSQLSLGQIGIYINFADYRLKNGVSAGQFEMGLIKSFEIEKFLKRNDLIVSFSSHSSATFSAEVKVEIGAKSLLKFLRSNYQINSEINIDQLIDDLLRNDNVIDKPGLIKLLNELELGGQITMHNEHLILKNDIEEQDIVYRLLKIIDSGKEPRKEDINADFASFAEWMEQIKDDRLATNISFSRGGAGNPIRIVHANNCELTKWGRQYLEAIESKGI